MLLILYVLHEHAGAETGALALGCAGKKMEVGQLLAGMELLGRCAGVEALSCLTVVTLPLYTMGQTRRGPARSSYHYYQYRTRLLMS
jgi:hypothetical protein